ncbi:MAG: putative D,D-dipeptide transport system permease protein DdpC [Anaerolineales bacterium]|nr:putative D,D-dipeptide transport system permease protein DdpC [Anaerolineales bacterium]
MLSHRAIDDTTRFLKSNQLALIGAVLVLGWVIVTVAAPVLAPYDPLEQNIVDRLQSPNASYLFGTDQLGRDVLSRVIFGGRLSLPAALLVVVIALGLGTVIGAVAGYWGGAWEEVLMRVTDVFIAFPTIILAMAVAAALGPNLSNAIVAMVVVWWPKYSRIVRGLVLSVRENEYVEASRAVGATEGHLLWRVVLPNCIAPALVMATLDFGNAILVFAGLSFLGLGPEPSTPEWGRMVSDGIQYFDQWWISAFPGLAIFTLVMAFNFVGDGLRDALDPRLRQQI